MRKCPERFGKYLVKLSGNNNYNLVLYLGEENWLGLSLMSSSKRTGLEWIPDRGIRE